MTDILVVVLCQVVLVGAWGLSRRIRRLEKRTVRPPCLGQFDVLRENVASMRADLAEVEDEQEHWARTITRSVDDTEDELAALADRFEHFSRLLLQQMVQLEERLAAYEPTFPAGLPMAGHSES
jgi:hypothetical protein